MARCFTTFERVVANWVAICCCVTHTVSVPVRTSRVRNSALLPEELAANMGSATPEDSRPRGDTREHSEDPCTGPGEIMQMLTCWINSGEDWADEAYEALIDRFPVLDVPKDASGRVAIAEGSCRTGRLSLT
jgi:hypothetical protein